MAKTAKEAASEFLAGVLGKLPEALQAKAKEVFEAAEAAPALEEIGGGVLRQSDYSRQMNDLATEQARLDTWNKNLTAWWGQHEGDVAEIERLRAEVAAAGTGDGKKSAVVDDKKPPLVGMTREDTLKLMEEREKGYGAYIAIANTLTLQHFQQFGEILDTLDLLKDPRVGEIGLKGVYEAKFADKLKEKATAADNARIEAEVRKRLDAERAKNPQLPYPVTPEPSTLDVLESKQKTDYTTESAIDLYNKLQEQRAARAGT